MIPDTPKSTSTSSSASGLSIALSTAKPTKATGATPVSTAATGATPPSSNVAAATSAVPGLHSRPGGQSILDLSLDLRTVTGLPVPVDEPALPSRSSTIRVKEKHSRSKQESRKRSTSSMEERTHAEVRSSKQRRISAMQTSPGSPRMVKSPRPVQDLRAAAGLSPRRSETGSPPTSPRSTMIDDRTEPGSPQAASKERTATQARTGSWIQPVFRDRAGHPAQGGLTLSPRRAISSGSVPLISSSSGSVPSIPVLAFPQSSEPSTASQEASLRGNAVASPGTPAHQPAVSPSGKADDFSFQDFDAGLQANGIAQTRLFDTDETSFLNAHTPVFIVMISAELSIAKAAFREAANAYLFASSSDSVRFTGNAPGSAVREPDAQAALPKEAFESAYIALQAKLALADFTFGLEYNGHIKEALTEILQAVEACGNLLETPDAIRNAKCASLRASLGALETACKTGLEALADEDVQEIRAQGDHAPGPVATRSAEPARLPFTLSTEALMNDLSALMDQEISVNPHAAATQEKKPKA